MKRHQFMLDLLRPGNAPEELAEWMCHKHELTTEDLDQIIKVAFMIVDAANKRKSELQK